ncbi:MAG: formate C-acetyltransferase/glycerol dehydratase family glycyl radical enzyme [Tissierellia bacterium]|nr:formate C-acetyltransferase/glycerol dehydratase family glycyl radical enzyme [Tissierellia bacterium]
MNSQRIEAARQSYINEKPSICVERSRIWTQSHKKTQGQAVELRRAQAFLDTCRELPVNIYEGELIVGSSGNYRKTGILTPEFSWTWVDREMDSFEKRPQDPYTISEENRNYLRKEIFPYWQGQSLEEAFLSQVPEDTAQLLIDTGILDNDSKWRQAIGEITPDYEDVLFPQGYLGIKKRAQDNLNTLEAHKLEDLEKINFYKGQILISDGIMTLAQRYSDKARELADLEEDPKRKEELENISYICSRVPANPPESFQEALQFVWFVQLSAILSENPLAMNLGRFDQYVYPYYKKDIEAGLIDRDKALELVQALWIKLSEWVWTISSNTANYFAGYNQFQNLTVGGRTRSGKDGTNELSFICLEATKLTKTHQPGLSVRIHPDSPEEFMMAVSELVSTGNGFPAIHSDQAGAQMLMQRGYNPVDARDWSNCGCVVPHFRKTGQWTSAVNVNFGSALEFSLNAGKTRLEGKKLGVTDKALEDFESFEEIKEAFLLELANLIKHSVIGSLLAQKLHTEMVPRPFISSAVDGCMDKGQDLSKGGAKYNLGPVLTGIGLGVVANGLAAVKELVFDKELTSLEELSRALEADWQGYDELRELALAVPKYGNDKDYVDDLAIEISDFFYEETNKYTDIFGSNFNTAFMGISNYVPTGKVVGALPCGRRAMAPLTEGVSPFVGSDVTSPTAAMRSAAKINHDVHTGGTLLNLRLNQELLETNRGKRNLSSLVRAFFSLGAFHVQFNTISSETLRKAQKNPENYRDLLVRVAGYSTQFVNLSKEMQEAIIARTQHQNF